ncbi:MAG: hypothetical protein NUV80_06920 [Candidatus Berkelbacteria bacterium]|nr:hypothetical protein [Candidatus Berkelbacteria bacterium]MCR4308260.1 hypothetical protein [Candidatus Berkelbacteria bacterium]
MKTNKPYNSGGSALLLTVMIIAILTTTTLASIAVRFDQLASTDKIANSAVAKSAADSALVKLKEKLAAPTAINPTIFDLDKNEETTPIPTPFRPSPRKIVSTYQKIQTSLPRCNGVIVLLPWTNDGQYLLNQTNDANPALIFNYANIVNDTPLGIIPGNGGLSPTDKDKTVSQLTNMGHFYNPFAPVGARQKDLNYWTVKLGGPQDQFLTKKSTDGVSSFYKDVDFVYLPYLPRWSDSGIFTSTPGTKVDRISASTLRTKFETIIKENNFKVWIDASISDAQLYQYGFGDLFVNSTDYKLKWLQPSLWNDTPEADDLSTPYKTDDAENATLTWSKKSQPVMTNDDSGWKTSIVKGAKSFSFIKLSTNPTFSVGSSITGLIYGSLEGLRLDQSITLVLLDKNQQPLSLQSRGQDQGRLYSVKLTSIGPTSISNGVESISVTFKLGNDDYNTPLRSTVPPRAVTGDDIDTIAVLAPPQFSTNNSIDSVSISINGTVITPANNHQCATICPAIGDLVSLTKAPNKPVWGKVTNVDFGSGTSFAKFTVDKLRQSPLPIREMAYTYFEKNGPKIAYYGGAVNMNEYDGGYASESDQLWIYDPEADSWTFPTQTNGTPPGRRAGASMVFDSVNQRLVMIGGYYHEAVMQAPNEINCETNQATCLYTNRPGLRIAKRVTNDVYAFDLNLNTWEKINYTFDQPTQKIQHGQQYTVRVTSTLADRSGLERWNWTVKNKHGTFPTLEINGTYTSYLYLDSSVSGLAKGDEVYLYGNKLADHSKFYAWGKVTTVIDSNNVVELMVYGYNYNGTGEQFDMESLALQVVKRQITTNTTCSGVIDATHYYCQLPSNDTTGYAVGDSVVLEQYDGNNLTKTLSGYINYIEIDKIYFVSDEKKIANNDFVIQNRDTAIAASDSAIFFPSPRYGASFALQPLAPTKASYWEGAAKNINYNMRFADLWNVQFALKTLLCTNSCTAAWSFQPTDNTIDPNFTTNSVYNFQVIRSNYAYQVSTRNVTGGGVNLEAVKDKNFTDRNNITYKIWDDSKKWRMEIDSNDADKVVVGAWATLERRTSDGSRETFHGIVEDMFTDSPCGVVYYAEQLCLRHNPDYPGDSGLSGDSKNVKVTMTPSFDTTTTIGGTFKGYSDHVSLQNVLNLGRVPGVGAMVMIWHTGNPPGTFPVNAYTFIVTRRAFVNNTFNIYFDKLIASPHPFSYSSSQIASASGSDRLITITDHQMNYYDSTNAPEWVKDVANNGAWKIRLSAKNPNLLFRPSPRRAGVVSSVYTPGPSFGGNPTPGTSKIFMTGGTFGQYGSLWKQNNAGATTTNTPAWTPQYVSPNSASDIPNLFGGSLIAYKSGGLTKLVYFGGKQKTDLSSSDYGLSIGAKVLGRPDNGNYIDNSYFIIDNASTADQTALSLTNTIISNKSSSWPSGVDNSLKFKGSNREGKAVCAYLGQVGCTSEELLSQLGNMGRLNDITSNETYNGWTWGRTALLTELGDQFRSHGDPAKASLIMSAPTLSGSGVNDRWDQDGYRPYLCDKIGTNGCTTTTTYGRASTNFGNKAGGLVAYSAINKSPDVGGAILATSVGVGTAIASNRGGVTGTTGGWYSYCAKSDTTVDGNGAYTCNSNATRYLPSLPDAEDLLFLLNATQALGATDTYKVVGYYGGVKRGYLVTSVSGTLPKVYEIVP